MQEQRFYFLVSRMLSGDATGPEKAELLRLIGEDEDLHALYREIFPGPEREEDDNAEALLAYTAHYTKMRIAGMFEETPAAEPAARGRRWQKSSLLAAAAVFIAVLAGGWWWMNGKAERSLASREVKTPKGSQSYLTLPDGTEVWLNANSKIVYGDDFNQSERRVQLTGEAYFSVAKDENKPFIIQAGRLKVKVLGTVFNIRSYPDETNIETTLVSGSVAITLDGQPGNTIQLKPGEKLSVHKRLDAEYLPAGTPSDSFDSAGAPLLLLSKMKIDPSDSTLVDAAWKEGKLVFDGDDFEKVASKIEKWYNVTIMVENEHLYNTRFTGTFGKKPLATVLSTLQATGKLTYRQQNDTIYVR